MTDSVPLYERPTDELRQVMRGGMSGGDKVAGQWQSYTVWPVSVVRVQRKWVVTTQQRCEWPPGKVTMEKCHRDEWRDLPIVTEAQVHAQEEEATHG